MQPEGQRQNPRVGTVSWRDNKKHIHTLVTIPSNQTFDETVESLKTAIPSPPFGFPLEVDFDDGSSSYRKHRGNRLPFLLVFGNPAVGTPLMQEDQRIGLDLPQKYLAPAPVVRDLPAEFDGWVQLMNARAIGLSVVGLGGGRRNVGDVLDHRVGLSGFCLVGDKISKGDSLLTIHAADEQTWQAAATTLQDAICVGRKTDALPAVYDLIT